MANLKHVGFVWWHSQGALLHTNQDETGKHIKAVDKFNSDNPNNKILYECYQYCGNCGDKYATEWVSIIKKNKLIFRTSLNELSITYFGEMSNKINEIYKVKLDSHLKYQEWLAKFKVDELVTEKYIKCKSFMDEYDTAYSLQYSYNSDLLWKEDT